MEENAMSERTLIPISAQPKIGKIDEAEYFRLYERSLADPDAFWGEHGKRLDWIKPYTKVCNASFKGDVSIRWYEDGTLNAAANCLDGHVAKRGDQTAILWEGDDPAEDRRVTYRELHESVCRLANALKARGVKKGDRVTIYLPMIPEAAVAMLACARIGAIHSVVFGGFSPDSLAGRIEDCRSTVLITADEGLRGGRKVPLKRNADTALKQCPQVKTVIVVKRRGGHIDWVKGRDHWYDEVCAVASPECPPAEMSAEDPLFILYTSGSTGKPKGVLHTTGGYLAFTSMTHEYVFDYRDGEIYWCTADVGWITGHSYIVYGPLANGATTVMFESVPTYPDPGRYWRMVDDLGIDIFYTAPTALRAIAQAGDEWVTRHTRRSLRILGTVCGDHQRFKGTYFSTYPGLYFTGDGCRRDADGYYWITGRIDDVLNVSGHRLGTAEVESALVAHEAVAEAAVVGFPHTIKGTGIYAYVLLASDYASRADAQLEGALKSQVRHAIGGFAAPDVIHIAPGLPKTRSGKIMRRILRKIAAGEYDGLGDTTTLAEPEVVEKLVAQHRGRARS